MRFLIALALFALSAPLALAQSPGNLPMSMNHQGIGTAQADDTYLRLDSTNDPLAAQLSINQAAPTLSTPTLTTPSNVDLVIAPGAVSRGITFSGSSGTTTDNGVTITGTAAAASGRTSVAVVTSVSAVDDRYVLRTSSALGDTFRVSGSGQIWSADGVTAPTNTPADPGYKFLGMLTSGLSGNGTGTVELGVAGGSTASASYYQINHTSKVHNWANGNASQGMTYNNSGGLVLFSALDGFASNAPSVFGRTSGAGATGTRVYGDHNNTLGFVGMFASTANLAAVTGVNLLQFRHNCGVSGSSCDSGGGTLIGDVRTQSGGGVDIRAGTFTGGEIDFSDTTFNPHRGTVPVALPTCSTTTVGLRYKEDTDTPATAPAFCLCSRDDAALTYSWKKLSGGGTC